jgi:putative DNA primase/helicase
MENDHVRAFIEAMHAAGVEPDEPIANTLASGNLIRFRCKDERKPNGWARLFLDGRPAGRFGNHRLAIDHTWKADAAPIVRTPDERAAYRAEQAEKRAQHEREVAEKQIATAGRAVALIDGSHPVDPAHPYLVKKRIVGEGLRQHGNMLLAPMQDAAGRFWNMQRIWPDGDKRFLTGGRVDGLFWLAGAIDAPLCLGEGVGTMSAVRRATGHCVAAAMHKSNLEPVARALRRLWPDRPIIVCADDDAHLVHNPRIRRNLGVDAARAAAAAIGARIVLPPRSPAYD